MSPWRSQHRLDIWAEVNFSVLVFSGQLLCGSWSWAWKKVFIFCETVLTLFWPLGPTLPCTRWVNFKVRSFICPLFPDLYLLPFSLFFFIFLFTTVPPVLYQPFPVLYFWLSLINRYLILLHSHGFFSEPSSLVSRSFYLSLFYVGFSFCTASWIIPFVLLAGITFYVIS